MEVVQITYYELEYTEVFQLSHGPSALSCLLGERLGAIDAACWCCVGRRPRCCSVRGTGAVREGEAAIRYLCGECVSLRGMLDST